MKFLILIALIFGSFKPAYSSDGGRGGGGLQLNGKNYTLSELGLKFDSGPEPYFLDIDTINVVQDLLKKLKDILPAKVMSKLEEAQKIEHHYQKMSVINPKLYNKIKNEYQSYIDSLSIKGKFILGAATDSKKGMTYLFPDFFSSETPIQTRALWLVTHEDIFFLKSNASLGQVLRFEAAIQHYLGAPDDYSTWMPVYDGLVNLEFLSVDEDLALYIRMLQLQGKHVTMANLVSPDAGSLFTVIHATGSDCKEDSVDSRAMPNHNFTIDPYVLRKSQAVIDPDFFKRFYDTVPNWKGLGFGCTKTDSIGKDLKPENVELHYYESFNGPSLDLVDEQFHSADFGRFSYEMDKGEFKKRFAPGPDVDHPSQKTYRSENIPGCTLDSMGLLLDNNPPAYYCDSALYSYSYDKWKKTSLKKDPIVKAEVSVEGDLPMQVIVYFRRQSGDVDRHVVYQEPTADSN